MNKLYFVFLLFFGVLVSFWACNDAENYSTNPRDLLSFSADTLRLDTVLSSVNTPVYAFKVYNRNDKSLLISSIRLKGSGENGFNINVDGEPGPLLKNVEIRTNDSLFVFVSIKPNDRGNNLPTLIADYIEFTTNNVRQNVVLEAYSQDVFVWKGVTLASDSILSNERPYLIFDSLVIKQGAVVELNRGATFYMHHGAEIIVEGTLRINGDRDSPVTIRGDRMDSLVGVSYDLIPGQWGGIHFKSTSFNNVFHNARIRNGNFGMKFDLSDLSESKMKMTDVVLTNFKGTLISSVNCWIEAENCEFSNSQGALLELVGGSYRFVHCTLANYYGSPLQLGWGNSDNETVVLSNTYYPERANAEPEQYAILRADFVNSIIWGSKYTSSSKIAKYVAPESSIACFFKNCLLPDSVMHAETGNATVDCVTGKDPKFKDTDYVKDQRYEFFYDFRLDSLSPARNIADPDISRQIPYDLEGIDRFADEGPDIGGYEFYSKQ